MKEQDLNQILDNLAKNNSYDNFREMFMDASFSSEKELRWFLSDFAGEVIAHEKTK